MARQTAQKNVAKARKKKKNKEILRKQEKEQEIVRRTRAREGRSNVESELVSDNPTDLDDMVFSDEGESGGVVATSAERRDIATSSAGDELVAMCHAADPLSRKHAASADVIGERALKRMRSPCPLTASLALSPPIADVAKQGGWSAEEWTNTQASLRLVLMHDSQPGEDLPAAGVVEHARWSEERTRTRVLYESQSEDIVSVAPVEGS